MAENPLITFKCMSLHLICNDTEKRGIDYREFEHDIDLALDYDFRLTLDWAAELRNVYNVQVLPQIIMVRASVHPMRRLFNMDNPYVFRCINNQVMVNPGDVIFQMQYYLHINGGKLRLPSVLKRSWAVYMESLSQSDIAYYRAKDLIDVVRVCHANSKVINELMRSGKVGCVMNRQVFDLHNILKFSIDSIDALRTSVRDGKYVPLDYYQAYLEVEKSSIKCKEQLLSALEECIDMSMTNMPQLSGMVVALSDNSVSSWMNELDEFSLVPLADIYNFCAVVTACCSVSGEGYVGKFGDTVQIYQVSKYKGILKQAREISKYKKDRPCGYGRSGVWEFWHKVIQDKDYWDNIFIYSGGHFSMGIMCGIDKNGNYTDLFDMVREYHVIEPGFSKTNVFAMQSGSYNHVIQPGHRYRTSMLGGLSGREVVFANAIVQQWDELDLCKREDG